MTEKNKNGIQDIKTLVETYTEQPMAITVRSDVKLAGGKKNPFAGRITKISHYPRVTLTGEATYRNRMKEKLLSEGKEEEAKDYQPNARPWGVRQENTAIIEHKDTVYVEFIAESEPDTSYYLDEKIIEDIDALEEDGYKLELPPKKERNGIPLFCVKAEGIIDLSPVVKKTV